MAKDFKEITQDISKYVAELKNNIPEVMAGFNSMSQAATKDAVLDKKTKELIALAIGVSQRCDGCIGFHTKALAKLGATKEEVAETLGMTIYMGGGPSLMYAADALRSFEQFTQN